MQHLVVAERDVFPARFRAFMTGQDFVAFDPNQQHADIVALAPDELVATFARYRRENLALIGQVKDDDL